MKIKKLGSKFVKLHILSFIFRASNGGKNSSKNFVKNISIWFLNLFDKSKINEKLWDNTYIINESVIVSMFDINVDRKKTIASKASSLNSVNNIENIIKCVISISFKNNTHKNSSACKNTISNIVIENHRNFQSMNSYLFIGLLSIRKMVFHSTSLKSNWLHTNNTHISQNTSIILNQKSTIILLSSHIVSFQSIIEKAINANAKNIIIYRNLFLTISLNVFSAMLNIILYLILKCFFCF